MRTRINQFFTVNSVLVLTLFNFALGQSNTPCGGSGAPSIPVNSSCVNSTVNITGAATQQQGAGSFGAMTCGSPGEDVWYSFVAPASGSVLIETTAGSITDAVMALYSSDCSGTSSLIQCDDDGGVGLMPQIAAGSLTPGVTYYIRFWQFGGGTGDFSVCVTSAAPPPTNITCSVPDPICSGSPIVFTAQANGTEADVVNPGNNYDCLFTSPNPSWYYLEIDSPGDLAIDITAGSDVDFAIWGPFPSLANAIANCNSYALPVDCSYSPAPTEQANVNGVTTGQVYVLLVTNFANTVQTITLNDAVSNTASTNCAIVLPVELISFEGYRNGIDVQLEWTTASESNSDYFIVERSTDGESWSAFAMVESVGNSNEVVNYSTVDRNASSGTVYYRLKQFDNDGKLSIHDMISVGEGEVNNLRLFPNPAKEEVSIHAFQQFNHVSVTDIRGNLVLSENMEYTKSHAIELNTLNRGMYFVTAYTQNGIVTERLVVE